MQYLCQTPWIKPERLGFNHIFIDHCGVTVQKHTNPFHILKSSTTVWNSPFCIPYYDIILSPKLLKSVAVAWFLAMSISPLPRQKCGNISSTCFTMLLMWVIFCWEKCTQTHRIHISGTRTFWIFTPWLGIAQLQAQYVDNSRPESAEPEWELWKIAWSSLMQVHIINKHPALCLHAEHGCIAVHQIACRGNSVHQGSSTFSMLEFRRRKGTYRVICGEEHVQ